MQVLIVANQSGSALSPLTDNRPVSLLSVAGKSILQHCIESVVLLKPESIVIAGSRDLINVRNFIEDGARWGLTMRTLAVKTDEDPFRIIENNLHLFSDNLLVIMADRIYQNSLQPCYEQLKLSAAQHDSVVHAPKGQLFYVPEVHFNKIDKGHITEIAIDDFIFYEVDSFKAYHAINISAAKGDINSLSLRGKERALGLQTGFMTRIHPRTIKTGQVFAGNRCKVHNSCRFNGTVVINSDVVIDRFTEIENSIILDNTYIGADLNVFNAIVDGNLLIRVDTSTVMHLSDNFITADISGSLYEEYFAGPLNQLVGALLFLITLPVWPIAFITAAIQSSGKIFKINNRVGNQQSSDGSSRNTFRTIEFCTNIGILRHLPLLAAVGAGHLQMVGVSAYTAEEFSNGKDSWQSGSNSTAGLIGPTQLYLGLNAPVDQRLLSDTVFAQQPRSMRVCFSVLKSALYALIVPNSLSETDLWDNVIKKTKS